MMKRVNVREESTLECKRPRETLFIAILELPNGHSSRKVSSLESTKVNVQRVHLFDIEQRTINQAERIAGYRNTMTV